MDSAAPLIVSPSSEERFWGKLRDRVDTILEQRNSNHSPSAAHGVESERGKRLREDSLLLVRGFDSAVSSLSQLAHTLDAAQQGLHDLAKRHPTEIGQRESQGTEADDEQPNAKRHCSLDKFPNSDKEDSSASEEANNVIVSQVEGPDGCKEAEQKSEDVRKSGNLKKAKNLAISMAGKATSLAKELKMIKSQLCFMQERCGLLEEENKRLRDGMDKGVRAEEDDLVRLQLETLLAEKSRLANENASLTRENQCLHQLVEYHQLERQDLSSPSYEETICGMRLDFSSADNLEDENNYAYTPSADKLALTSSLDKEHSEEQLP